MIKFQITNYKSQTNSKFQKEWAWVIFAGLGILALALFLRTHNLLGVPIFADESIYIRWAQIMRAEPTLRFLPLSDGKQPLFMWTVIPFLKVFSDPLIAGRMVSVFAGLATIVGIFLLSQKLFQSKKVALLSASLYAVSPFSVFFDRMALVDSMLTSFGVWVFYFGVLTAQTLWLAPAMLTGFALGGAWLTKSPAVFFLLLLPTTVLVIKKATWVNLLKLSFLWGVSWFIASGMYNILRLGPNFHLVKLRNADYVFTLQEALVHPFDPLKAHLIEIAQWFWMLLPWTVATALLFTVFLSWKRYWRMLLLLGVWVIVPLFVQAEFAKVFTSRYLLFTIPPIFILVAASLFSTVTKFNLGRKTLFLLAAFFAVPLYLDYRILVDPSSVTLSRDMRSGYFEEWTAGTGTREVAEHIKKQSLGQKGGVVVGTEGYFGTPLNALEMYLADIPGVVLKGVGITISDVDNSLKEAKKAGNKVYLVVNKSRFTGDPEQLGLKLISSYHKAQKLSGEKDSLLFFEFVD